MGERGYMHHCIYVCMHIYTYICNLSAENLLEIAMKQRKHF